MKKVEQKIISIILIMAVSLSALSLCVTASDFTVDLAFTSADTIEKAEFKSNTLVGTVTFVANDTENPLIISEEAFRECENLTSVTFIGEGDIIISDNAFYKCTALENVTFDVEGSITFLEEAFMYCSSITELSFDNITQVLIKGHSCFYGIGIKELSLNQNVVFVDFYDSFWEEVMYSEFTFAYCSSLEELQLNCNTPGFGTFIGCTNLKAVCIPPTVTDLGRVSLGCDGLYAVEDFALYGHTGSAAQDYCNSEHIKFIPVDSAEFNTITSSQSSTATIGTPTSVTLSVAGFPETIKLENPLGSELTFAREDAEIVTNETGEQWTINLTPMSEADTYTITADYGLADLCSTDEITVYAKEDTRPPVISVETITHAPIGETAQISVTVKGSPEAIRFVDENTKTISREKAQIVENDDNSETWTVNLLVNSDEQQFTVYAKDETGWLEQGTDFTLTAKVIVYSTEIKDFAFEESLDGVIYNGVNKITLTTANGVTKVQFMKNGNTWTYTENNSEVIEIDGQKYWTIRMNFCTLGDNTYDIRVRSPKTTFEIADTLNVTVYSR